MKHIIILMVVALALIAFIPHGENAVTPEQKLGVSGEVNATVIFQFGNENTASYTVTLPSDNHTALKATELACANLSLTLNYSWGTYGALVNQIGWEKNDWSGTGYYWHLMVWSNKSYSWKVSNSGASNLNLTDGGVVAWLYTVDNPNWMPYDTVQVAPGYMNAWLTQRGDYNNTGVSHTHIIGDNIAWQFKGLSSYGFSSTPVVSHGIIYIADGSAMYALTMHGDDLWNSTSGAAGYWGMNSPIIYGKYVIIYSTNNTIRALYRDNGTVAWGFKINGAVTSSPVVAMVNKKPVLFAATYVSDSAGQLYAIYIENGTLFWNVSLMGSNYYGSPAIYNNTIIVPIGGIENSSYVWNAPYGVQAINFTGGYVWNYTSSSSVRTAPVVSGGHIYFDTAGGNLIALNVNGTIAWEMNIGPSTAPPAVYGNVVYVGNNTGGLYAIKDNGTSGTVLWQKNLNGPVKAGLLYVSGRIIAVTDTSNSSVYCLYSNGTLAWNFTPEPKNYILSSPVAVDSYLLIASNNGYLYALTENASLPSMGAMSVGNAVIGAPIKVSISASQTYMAVLYYKNTTGNEWHTVWMSYENGEYIGYVPSQSTTGTLAYYVTLTDSQGTSKTSQVQYTTVSSSVPELTIPVVALSILIIVAVVYRRKV